VRDITKLPHDLDRDARTCQVVIETPKGNRSKYDFDPDSGLFRLQALLPEGMSFPLDFGFVPSTLCEDGDPLDAMVLADEPSAVGALIPVRLIGVFEAEERERGEIERNDRLLAIPVVSHLYGNIQTIGELDSRFLHHLSDFWVNKAKLEGKSFKLLDVKDGPTAVALVHTTGKHAKHKQ
jgi:inorganic pyrophosphatase